MPKLSDEKRLEKLIHERAEIDKEINQLKTRMAAKQQQEDDEKLKLYGLLILRELEEGKRNETELLEALDPVVRTNDKRRIVGLELTGAAGKKKTDPDAEPMENPIKEQTVPQLKNQIEEETAPPRAGEPAPPQHNVRRKSSRPPASPTTATSQPASGGKQTNARKALPEKGEMDLSAHFGR